MMHGRVEALEESMSLEEMLAFDMSNLNFPEFVLVNP